MPTYVLTTVCLQIYNDAGDLIRMMPVAQAQRAYPELFDRSAPGEASLSAAFGEIKLNKSREEKHRECPDG